MEFNKQAKQVSKPSTISLMVVWGSACIFVKAKLMPFVNGEGEGEGEILRMGAWEVGNWGKGEEISFGCNTWHIGEIGHRWSCGNAHGYGVKLLLC